MPNENKPSMLMSISLEQALRKIEAIAAFPYGWDGYGAPPLPNRLTERVRNLVKQLPAIPFISATADETIQIEYEDEHRYLEFEIPKAGQIRLGLMLDNNVEGWREDWITEQKLVDLVRDFDEQRL